MASLVFIEYPRCTTCKRAKKFLDEAQLTYTDRHIVEQCPSAEELKTWIARSEKPLRRFFNTSGMVYRQEHIKDKLDAGMTNQEAIDLLASNGMLIKRPLLIGDDFVLVGFKEDEWSQALGLK